MKLQILQENFAKAISQAGHFTSSRAQLPILGNILLSAKKTKLNISSTNLEISFTTSLSAKIEKDGEISVPSKILVDLVNNLPKETLNLEAQKEKLEITTNSFSTKVLGMDSSDFPKVPKSVDKNKALILEGKDFSEALKKVLFSASSDETRPILTGILFDISDGKLTLVSTDGFRLSRVILKSKILNPKSSFILPKNILNEIVKLDNEQISIEIQEKEKQVVFEVEDTIISSRLIEGDFPDYEKIIPKTSTISIEVDKEDLLRAVKLAAPFARDNSNIVKLGIGKGELVVSAESSSGGSQETRLDLRIDTTSPEASKGEDFEVAFNYKFLEDFLGSVEGEEVRIELTSTDKAGVFLDPKDENYLHLIMPVRTQS